MAREIQKLRTLARKWGGDLAEVTPKEWDRLKEERLTDRTRTFHEAPFTGKDLGVHWPTRRVIYSGEVAWVEVIHEMGHAFATLQSPDHSDELEFFGWEYALVRFIGASEEAWIEHNRDYGIDDGEEFGGLDATKRTVFLKAQVTKGQELGIIDGRGRPRTVQRTLDIGRIQLELRERSQMFQGQAKKARETPPLNGNAYEKRCEASGFSEGYDQAIQDVMGMLFAMTVAPVSMSKRCSKGTTKG